MHVSKLTGIVVAKSCIKGNKKKQTKILFTKPLFTRSLCGKITTAKQTNYIDLYTVYIYMPNYARVSDEIIVCDESGNTNPT